MSISYESLKRLLNGGSDSVFKFDANGNLMVAVQDSIAYDSANDWYKMSLQDSIGYDSLLTAFRTHSTGDEVYDRTVSIPNFVASGMEYAYTTLSLKAHQLVRGAEFLDALDIYNGGGITVAYGGYVELGGV